MSWMRHCMGEARVAYTFTYLIVDEASNVAYKEVHMCAK